MHHVPIAAILALTASAVATAALGSSFSSAMPTRICADSEHLPSSFLTSAAAPASSRTSLFSSGTPTPTSHATAESLSLTQRLLLADTATDRFDLLPNDEQFVFDFNQSTKAQGYGGKLIVANRRTFPALIGTGGSMAVGYVGPCGLNTFHIHPRSAEFQLVVQGRLRTEMVPENGVLDSEGNRRVIRNELGRFQMLPFYQGSFHTQFNPDCVDAIFVASFTSEDSGTGQVLDQTLAFSNDIIAASFGQSVAGEDIDNVREAIPMSIAAGVDECLQRCGLQKRGH